MTAQALVRSYPCDCDHEHQPRDQAVACSAEGCDQTTFDPCGLRRRCADHGGAR